MKQFFYLILSGIFILHVTGCRTTKQINKAIAPKDTSSVRINVQSAIDSIALINNTLASLEQNKIDFKTFNAKIKVEYQDKNGRHPDITAIVRIIKDSAIWISLSATILNFEVYRMLISRDSVILLNRQEKEVQYRSMDYLQEVTELPINFYTLQNLIVGNPVFVDNNIIYYKKTESQVLFLMVGQYFKNLLTLSSNKYLLTHCKLDDVDMTRNRTADLTYGDYENKTGINFSTYREITVSEKNKLDIRLNFKNYEFNKELSVYFNIPKNYKSK